MRSITLWRAATDDYVPDAASFARDRADAEAYLNNRGFGGPVLWKARVATDESRVLNLYDEQEPMDFLTHLLDMPHPGAIGVEEWIPMRSDVQEALAVVGYDWVVVRESFPADSETWLWIGPFDREPTLVPATPRRP